MKIGMILDAIYPSDARVTNECEELIKNGHEVYLFCVSYQKNYIKSEIINGIKVRRYYCSSLTYKLSALANDFPFYSILMKSKIKDFSIFEIEWHERAQKILRISAIQI